MGRADARVPAARPEPPPVRGLRPRRGGAVRIERLLLEENPGIPKLPITLWQVWNEPNSPLFWKPKPDPGGYAELLRGFDSTVERADPNAQSCSAASSPRRGAASPWRLHGGALPGPSGHFDAAAIHPYAANPQNALASTADLRDVMDRSGDAETAIWISEVGWASGGAVGPHGRPRAAGRVPDPDVRAHGTEPRAARAGGRDLVFAQRYARVRSGPRIAACSLSTANQSHRGARSSRTTGGAP